jgi:dihydrofolate synthase/folylpolyglutamate synthase
VATDPLDYLFSLEQFGVKFGLDNIRAIVRALGHPERSFLSAHIAGTNGKGSVTALVDSALRAAGHRSARYTSPHLVELTERFVVNGEAVSLDSLRERVSIVRSAIHSLLASGELRDHPTFFEVTTAVAFELFRQAAVEIAVCEVGMGGRLDATNVLEPAATAIVSIGMDHEKYLGDSPGAIAAEKAGIVKAGVPIVIGDLDAEAESVIARVADRHGARLIRARSGVRIEGIRATDEGIQTFRLRTASTDYGPVTLGLSGAHQVNNALVAVSVLEVLAGAGLNIPAEAVRQGFAAVVWPGRLQHIRLEDGRGLLIDAAHNPEGARALAAFLAERPPRPLVFGTMRDKNAEAILEMLLPRVSAIVTTRAVTPRAADPGSLANIARRVAPPPFPVRCEDSVADALAAAWSLNRDIVVAGSVFLLGDVLKALKAIARVGPGASRT